MSFANKNSRHILLLMTLTGTVFYSGFYWSLSVRAQDLKLPWTAAWTAAHDQRSSKTNTFHQLASAELEHNKEKDLARNNKTIDEDRYWRKRLRLQTERIKYGSLKENKEKLASWLEIKDDRPETFPCKQGYFALAGMSECEPWLGCEAIENEVKSFGKLRYPELPRHYRKKLHMGTYKNHSIALFLSNNWIEKQPQPEEQELPLNYFNRSIELSKQLSHTGRSAQFVGECNHTVYITEFLPLGDLRKYAIYFPKPISRLRGCKSLADVFTALHSQMLVNYDTYNINRVEEQFLIRGDGDLVVGDLDYVFKHNSRHICQSSQIALRNRPLVPPSWRKPCKQWSGRTVLRIEDDIFKFPVICKMILGEYSTLDWLNKDDATQLEELFARCQANGNVPTSFTISEDIQTIIDKYIAD